MAVFTSKHQYTREPKKRPMVGMIVGGILLCVVGGVIWTVAPKNIFIEVICLTILTVGLFFFASWIWGRKKWGAVTTVGVMYLLILNRLEYLNWATVGILLVIVGLISLIN